MIYGSINLTNLKAIFAKNSKKERKKKHRGITNICYIFVRTVSLLYSLKQFMLTHFRTCHFWAMNRLNRIGMRLKVVWFRIFYSFHAFPLASTFLFSHIFLSIWLMVQLHWVPYHVTNSPFIPIHIACVYI